MARIILTILAAAAMLACEPDAGAREHGAAPSGTFAPGGPVDDRSNAATSRALGEPVHRESVAQWQATEPDLSLEQRADLQDAGAIDRWVLGVAQHEVEGRVVSTGAESLRVAPAQGQPVQLQVDETALVTWEGSLISAEVIPQGAQVRAAYRLDEGRAVAETVELLPADEGQAPAP